MNAAELFRAGRLQAAIESQLNDVRAAPADNDRRVFLFELFAFAGDLERAARQLDALQFEEPELMVAATGYREVVAAETKRRAFFAGGAAPQFLAEPPEHVKLRLIAAKAIREGRSDDASTILREALEKTPVVAGRLDGRPFDGICDGDELLGTVLEVFAKGNYYWVPFEQVDGVAANPPRFPRDLLYFPAKLSMAESQGDVFLPTLYPDSYKSTDDAVRLGRDTQWTAAADGPSRGLGLKTYLVGEDSKTLLDLRDLQCDGPTEPTGPAAAVGEAGSA